MATVIERYVHYKVKIRSLQGDVIVFKYTLNNERPGHEPKNRSHTA